MSSATHTKLLSHIVFLLLELPKQNVEFSLKKKKKFYMGLQYVSQISVVVEHTTLLMLFMI